jgi:ribose 1,5-bisphosphokinase PhnN
MDASWTHYGVILTVTASRLAPLRSPTKVDSGHAPRRTLEVTTQWIEKHYNKTIIPFTVSSSVPMQSERIENRCRNSSFSISSLFLPTKVDSGHPPRRTLEETTQWIEKHYNKTIVPFTVSSSVPIQSERIENRCRNSSFSISAALFAHQGGLESSA